MKKVIKRAVLTALVLSVPTIVSAKIVGNCSDCHTMHNSELGQPVAVHEGVADSPTPNEVLLKYDCIACHANTSQPAALWTMPSGSVVPQVYGSYANDRAGGNFAYIDGTKGSGASDRKGHNVIDLLNADATLTGPPGYARGPAADQTNNTSVHTFQMASQFTCAGKAGCHGVRNQLIAEEVTDVNGVVVSPEVQRVGLAALTGAHHYNVNGDLQTADDIYNSFRFLLGTKGYETDTYAHNLANHNEYAGANNVTFAAGFSGCDRCHEVSHGAETVGYVTNRSGTITNLCETCHSNFHSSQDQDGTGATTGAFLRHPSDFIIQNKTEYALMDGTWHADAPVARLDWSTGVDGTAGPGDVVACISCHSSHGTDYDHMLRFDYTAIVAGGGADTAGCFVCHTTKDTGDGNTWGNPMLQ